MRFAETMTAGTIADRYTIVREVGHGGMATVFEANDLKHNRRVAMKLLRPDLSAALGPERFKREIEIAAQLSHPHIVPLIDSGEFAGVKFYVAQYVPGGSLRDRLRANGRLSIPEAVRIATEVGGALDFAHRSNVIHRDVKPENILFLDGHAMLTDFGIARACVSEGSTIITGSGMILGTPEYMSPEQASGDDSLGAASDIYSLACVVYEMLGGVPPFHGPNARATMARQVTEAAPLIRSLRPDVPLSIERALERALAKDQRDRHPTCGEFIEGLTEVSPLGTAPQKMRMRAVAVLPFVNMSPDADNEYLSDGITDELIDALSRVRGLRIASRTSVFALKGSALDVRAIGALLGVAEVLEGTVRKSGDQLRITAQLTNTADGSLRWSQRFDRTIADVFAIQDEIAHTIVNTLRATTFADLSEPLPRRYAENVKAYGLYLRGRYAWNLRTKEGLTNAIRYFEQAIEEEPTYAPAFAGLADSYALHVDYKSVPVAEGFERAKEYARKAIALDDRFAEAHASLAWCLFIYDWDELEAEREFKRAIALDPTYATAHQWYASLLSARGTHSEAIIEGHTAMELDPNSVSVRRTLATQYYYARRYDQACYHFDRALAMNPMAEETSRYLGVTCLMMGHRDEAERVLRSSLALPGAGAYDIAYLAYALAVNGKPDEARTLRAELDRLAARGYVSPVAYAIVHLGLGEWSRTLDYAELAVAERRGWAIFLNVNPLLDPIRSDPRFQQIIRRVRGVDVRPV